MFPTNKFKFSVLGLLILITLLGVYAIRKPKPAEPKVHYHAGFVVFQNGKKLNFSDIKFMNLEPCTKDNKKNGDEQLEKAHLHDNIGDVVHVEAPGAIWQDLFTNIKFPINYASTSGFINHTQVSDFQKLPINKDDSLVVFIGPIDQSLLTQAVTVERIEQVGTTSKTCGD